MVSCPNNGRSVFIIVIENVRIIAVGAPGKLSFLENNDFQIEIHVQDGALPQTQTLFVRVLCPGVTHRILSFRLQPSGVRH